jgi:EpsI family protein
MLWWLGWVANVQKIEQLAAYLLFLVTLVALGGWKNLLVFRFPALIVLFVMPIWHFLQKPLQELSVHVTVRMLKLLDIPTLLVGNLISVPGGDFLVEEACSGLGFLLAAITVVTFYSYLSKLNWIQSCKLAALAGIMAVSANWIRIISILVVGNYQGMSHYIVNDHLTFGWFVFGIALIPFFLICYYWFPARSESAHMALNETDRQGQSADTAVVPILSICIALTIVPIAAQIHDSFAAKTSNRARILPDNMEAGISQLRFRSPNWETVFAGVYDKSMAMYEYDGQEFTVLIVQYNRQQQGQELIHVKNRLYSNRWNEVREDNYPFLKWPIGSVRLKLLSTAYKQRRQIAYWYVVGGQATSSPYVAKVLQVYGVLTGDRTALLIAVAIDKEDSASLLEIARKVYNWERSNI